jgi:hypothetical protein
MYGATRLPSTVPSTTRIDTYVWVNYDEDRSVRRSSAIKCGVARSSELKW